MSANNTNKQTGVTMTFNATTKHIATSGKLVALDGRKDNGVDLYVPLASLVNEYGGVPTGYKVTVIIEADSDEIVDSCLAMVPRTEQNRFEGNKADFIDIYGMTLAEYVDQQGQTEPAKPITRPKRPTTGNKSPMQIERERLQARLLELDEEKAALNNPTPAKPAGRTPTRPVKPVENKLPVAASGGRITSARTTQPKPERGAMPSSEASSMADRMSKLENTLQLLLEKL